MLKQSVSEINADLLKYYAEMQNVFKEFEVQETMKPHIDMADDIRANAINKFNQL